MDDHNPSEPAMSSGDNSLHFGDASPIRGNDIYAAWGGVFMFNILVPAFFGWLSTTESGRTGMVIAVVVQLCAGFWVCAKVRTIGLYLVIGGFAVALSQVFPILQFIAGAVALGIGRVLGLANTEDNVTSEFGGFIVTMITGGILMALSAGCGFLVQQIGFERWFRASAEIPRDQVAR
jgi:hypothetical protein